MPPEVLAASGDVRLNPSVLLPSHSIPGNSPYSSSRTAVIFRSLSKFVLSGNSVTSVEFKSEHVLELVLKRRSESVCVIFLPCSFARIINCEIGKFKDGVTWGSFAFSMVTDGVSASVPSLN